MNILNGTAQTVLAPCHFADTHLVDKLLTDIATRTTVGSSLTNAGALVG